MIHYHIKNSKNITGFSLNPAREGQMVNVALKGYVTSDNPSFHSFVDGIYKAYLKRFITLEKSNKFLIIRKKDKSADIYINDFNIYINIRTKKSMEAGTIVHKNEIADITKLTFQNISIEETDAVIFCIRVGWKFGFYFNFSANPGYKEKTELDVEDMYCELGYRYRNMLFEHEYNLISNNTLYPKMLDDGWFPFIELIGGDYTELSNYYAFNWGDHIDDFVKKFDESRIRGFTQYWWNKPQFQEKRKLIEAGLSAFLRGDNEGYINCINTLIPQIEGIMGYEYFLVNGEKPSFNQLKTFIQEKAKNTFPSIGSLGFPDYFYDYLNIHLYQFFDLSTGKIDLGRHSVAHGYAKPEDYTKVKALQLILVLNQIFFYL